MINRRAAKRAFVIAEMLKGGDFDTEENLLASLERVEREVAPWREAEIDAFIRDRDSRRFQHFQRAAWSLDRVDLDRCVVWWRGGMGQRGEWATGKLLEIADSFKLK